CRNISSPINQNIQPPGQRPVKRPMQNNYNNPPNVTPGIINPQRFTPQHTSNNFSPIHPRPQVYTPTPPYSSPPPPPPTPEGNKITPSYLPRQILN
ncbi:unnamed protein product, partial [Rotaria magnacalcarata]